MKNIDSTVKWSALCCSGVIFHSLKLCVMSMIKCINPANTPIVNDWNTSDNTMKWNIASNISCTSHVFTGDFTMLYMTSPNIM